VLCQAMLSPPLLDRPLSDRFTRSSPLPWARRVSSRRCGRAALGLVQPPLAARGLRARGQSEPTLWTPFRW
jgi:hypothetical protein